MGLLSKLKKILANTSTSEGKDIIKLKVECDKCSQKIDSVFRKSYDLQRSYGNEDYAYLINKKLVCPGCYNKVSLRVELDKGFRQISKEVTKGKIIKE
ncbi:hypothetical protein [Halonatronum saccharophilum]|uniref:hypothetical protein n=1 Tax=Halonatronum saccharophilum TaxID=150060 RepID=UPI0004817515|nr:hypothetical protein [Halonatronum saccharophilum]